MVYFHKLTHACHCYVKMWSVCARPDFLLLRWDCWKMEKCRSEGVNSVCHSDIRLLSVYCVLLMHPLTAPGALSSSLIGLSHQLETSEHSNCLSFAVTQRASQQPWFAPAVATWALSDCVGPARRLLFGNENASSLFLGKSGACFGIWNLWCLYF